MKPVFVIMFVGLLALSIESSPANHKKHAKASKAAEEPTDIESQEPEWPTPPSVNDFQVPDGFGSDALGDGGDGSGNDYPSSGKHHGKSHKHHRN